MDKETIQLSEIFSEERILEALDALDTKRDTCGVDGVFLSDLREYWKINGGKILETIYNDSYTPELVKLSEIIQYNGKRRMIACYTSVDRLIQRCISQTLQERYDKWFNPNSYACRMRKGIEAAVAAAAAYYSDGFLWTARVDIQHFYDSIDHKILSEKLFKLMPDSGDVRRLIVKYSAPTIECNGEIRKLDKSLFQAVFLN